MGGRLPEGGGTAGEQDACRMPLSEEEEEQVETHIAARKTPQGETQMEACRAVFSSGLLIISPSLMCMVWSLELKRLCGSKWKGIRMRRRRRLDL